jgi:uncharacterized protein YjbI with pentapeptide repeats
MYNYVKKDMPFPTVDLKSWYEMINAVADKYIEPYYIMYGFKASGIDLIKFNATSSDFFKSNFEGTVVTNGIVTGCNLTEITLNGSDIIDSNYSLTSFIDVTAKDLLIQNTKFDGTDFINSVFTNSNFSNCSFDCANIDCTIFKNCNFLNCLFSGTIFNCAEFDTCDLENSFFEELLISDLVIKQTSLSNIRAYPFTMSTLEDCISA